jgi:hypothetical protein
MSCVKLSNRMQERTGRGVHINVVARGYPDIIRLVESQPHYRGGSGKKCYFHSRRIKLNDIRAVVKPEVSAGVE